MRSPIRTASAVARPQPVIKSTSAWTPPVAVAPVQKVAEHVTAPIEQVTAPVRQVTPPLRQAVEGAVAQGPPMLASAGGTVQSGAQPVEAVTTEFVERALPQAHSLLPPGEVEQ